MPEQADNRVERLWNDHLHNPAAAFAQARTLLEDVTLAPRERAWVQLTVAYHHLFSTGAPTEARPWLERALAFFRCAQERRGEILAITGAARLLIVEQQPARARDELLAVYEDAALHLPPRDRFWVINALGAAYFFTDDIDEAIRYLYEALESLRSIELSPQLPIVMSNLAAALVTVADYVPARELAQDALARGSHARQR
jgi:tetratricopeptide (TPR) repeat protein